MTSSDGMIDGPGPRRLPPEMRREQTRTYLLDAAAAVFATRGYHTASLDEIADAAGFTKGAIYSNFGSKEDLFLALVKQRQEQMVEQFFAASHPDTEDPDTTTTEVFRRLAPNSQEWALWEEFVLYAIRNPEIRDRFEAFENAAFEAVVVMVEQGCRARGIEPPLRYEELARLYSALFNGLARQRALDPNNVPDDLFARLIAFIDDAIIQLGTPNNAPSP